MAADSGNPASEAEPAKPQPSRPLQSAEPEAQKARLLHELFDRLSASPDPETSAAVAAAIERVWMKSGSDSADFLMGRATAAMQAKDNDLALSLLDRIVILAPDWAEGWNRRATVKFLQDDLAGSMLDIQHVLQLEPRHFGALSGMGFLLQKQQLDASAYRVFSHVLEIYPHLENVKKIAEKLKHELNGQSL